MRVVMLEFALAFLARRFWKNLAVFGIFTILVFLLASTFLIAGSLKKELFVTLDGLPDIYVQRTLAGRLSLIPQRRVESIEAIEGVQSAYGRYWGYYYFPAAGVNFTVLGLDMDMAGYAPAFDEILAKRDLGEDEMIVGRGVYEVLRSHYYKDFFNFITPTGDFIKVKIAGVFSDSTQLESSDTIVVSSDLAKRIFGQKDPTDITVRVSNPKEIPTIATKIRNLYPDCRVITRADLKASYQNLFDYKSGLFLALLIASFLAFFILIFEKASSVGREQIKEIAILKAIGWQISDVLGLKFLESILVSAIGFLVGVTGGYFFVYILQAPLLRNIFTGFSVLKPQFQLIPVWDWGVILGLFFLSVPLYLAATIIPSWRASVIDPEEALR